MKLTNYIRDAFVTSVMNDVPKKDFHEEGKKIFLEAHLDGLPTEVQMAWSLPATRPYVRTSTVSMCGTSFVAPHDSQYNEIPTPRKAEKKLLEIKAAYKAQRDNRDALRAKVKGAAYACTTTKQLRELLPEFDRYLPAEEEKTLRTLPVVQNIVADFVKAGWPAKKGGAK
ncbi:hypothetical protein UFOVP147_16 [uncultured Caudovirales phage]|uniref:Nucleotide modification associated domain-containing protein n=1 Tax=uncultured Caudovirales phage TaxID=2100421 RepID=A0A6J7W168_9CAUD|nr:hypothetical protein UFOVP147_16 [uncultured Caudovirales phage]